MAATNPQVLFDEGKCYACVGVTTAQIMKLALMARTLKALVPSADTSYQALLSYAHCYICENVNYADALELALLDQIYQAL